jgi:molybdopterin/thiamine biosynthesis adenylyltransferase
MKSGCKRDRDESVSLSESVAETVPHGLSSAQISRYSRQLLVPAFGVKGQKNVCASSVLVVGCGGLGSAAIMYLAGVGLFNVFAALVFHEVHRVVNAVTALF